MAQFRGIVQRNRESVSRLGSKKSGISTVASGWYLGIRVSGFVDSKGEDCFTVTLTGGSTSATSDKLIGTFTKDDLITQ